MPGRASEFTADARDAPRTSVPERADSEAVAGRLVPSYVLQRSAAGAAPRCAGGRPGLDRFVPFGGCRMPRCDTLCGVVDGRIVL